MKANITMNAYVNKVSKQAYFTRTKGETFSFQDIDVEFIINDINEDSITVDFSKEYEGYKLSNNIIKVGETVKVEGPNYITIKLDSIEE